VRIIIETSECRRQTRARRWWISLSGSRENPLGFTRGRPHPAGEAWVFEVTPFGARAKLTHYPSVMGLGRGFIPRSSTGYEIVGILSDLS